MIKIVNIPLGGLYGQIVLDLCYYMDRTQTNKDVKTIDEHFPFTGTNGIRIIKQFSSNNISFMFDYSGSFYEVMIIRDALTDMYNVYFLKRKVVEQHKTAVNHYLIHQLFCFAKRCISR